MSRTRLIVKLNTSKANLNTFHSSNSYQTLQENEFFQENLRLNQNRLLKVSKDRSFLLDRLLKYEAPESSTESEASESSDDEPQTGGKKRKLEGGQSMQQKKKKILIKKQQNVVMNSNSQVETDDVAMVERHLEARNSISMPSFTFPQEIFDEVEFV